ncbi:MAG: peptide chain release factor N(5)-glutamine methyltransferase [Planctomycetia bacterium]|nr:peptide chain release factor N(5)-glutamine methyltransferase [Planctomycetia bacterium]
MTTLARSSETIWRVIDLIKWGEKYFSENKFDNPRKEIESLLQDILECNRVDLYLRFEEPLTKVQLTKLHGWVQRRKNREPLQYITGKAGFYNLVLNVTPGVLIPRPESERLIEVLIETIGKKSNISILDIGTGSGCLALALGKELPKATITGIDKSAKAIEIAQLNAETLKIDNVNFIQIDLIKNKVEGKYDIVISNPPYISQNEIEKLMPDVKNFEPHSALTDSADGLTFYRKILEISKEIMNLSGWLFLEVGLGEHPKKAMQLFSGGEFKNIALIKDYNGDDRVLKAQIV